MHLRIPPEQVHVLAETLLNMDKIHSMVALDVNLSQHALHGCVLLGIEREFHIFSS